MVSIISSKPRHTIINKGYLFIWPNRSCYDSHNIWTWCFCAWFVCLEIGRTDALNFGRTKWFTCIILIIWYSKIIILEILHFCQKIWACSLSNLVASTSPTTIFISTWASGFIKFSFTQKIRIGKSILMSSRTSIVIILSIHNFSYQCQSSF